MKVILQKSFNDCGLACLAMVSSHFKKGVELEAIVSLLKYDDWKDGVTLKQMGELAPSVGLRMQAVKCPVEKLRTIPMPGIAHCVVNHYVVVEHVDDKYVRFVDPRHGRATVSLEEFKTMYSNIFLAFNSDEEGDESMRAARILSRQLVTQDPWLRVSGDIFRRELLRLVPLAVFYSFGLILSLSIWLGWLLAGLRVPVVSMVVNLIFLAGLVIFRLSFVEGYLLRCYDSLAHRLGQECLIKTDYFHQDAQTYKLDDRYRWLIEFVYFQRYAILSALQIASSLLLAAVVALVAGDYRAALVPIVFALTLWLEIKGSLYAEDQTESRYYQRTLLHQLLASYQNGNHKKATTPQVPFMKGTVSFGRWRWWLPALAAYLPAAVLIAALIWIVRGSLSQIPFARLIMVVSLLASYGGWQFVKGQTSGFMAILVAVQQLNFMSFMRQLNKYRQKNA